MRQVSTDVLAGKNNSNALTMIKEHFGKGSEIYKELELYQTLLNIRFKSEHKANALVDAVISARKRLDEKKIRKQKYGMIKEIQRSYDVDAFFKSDVANYRILASIYKLFEDATSQEPYNPSDVLRAKTTLTEHISGKVKSQILEKSKAIAEYEKQPEDIRLLTTKILVDKFNQKYSSLSPQQKSLLKEYINNTAGSLKKFIELQTPQMKKELVTLAKTVDDKVTKIKLTEVVKQIDTLYKGREVKDEQVSAMLNYYELISELKNLQEKK
jgi:hypothetical protein